MFNMTARLCVLPGRREHTSGCRQLWHCDLEPWHKACPTWSQRVSGGFLAEEPTALQDRKTKDVQRLEDLSAAINSRPLDQKMSESGVVKCLRDGGRWGFIAPDSPDTTANARGNDVFWHVNDVSGHERLQAGDRVRYDLALDEWSGKYRAVNIVGVTSTSSSDEHSESEQPINKLDLHGMTVAEAEKAVEAFLVQWNMKFEELENEVQKGGRPCVEIVYGRGSHSLGGNAKLRPAICQLVSRLGLQMEWVNDGAMHVLIPRPSSADPALRKYELRDGHNVAQLAKERQKNPMEVPELPAMEDMWKSALSLMERMNQSFLRHHGLKGRGSTKRLEKMKWSEFKEIFLDFQRSASAEEISAYSDLMAPDCELWLTKPLQDRLRELKR